MFRVLYAVFFVTFCSDCTLLVLLYHFRLLLSILYIFRTVSICVFSVLLPTV